MSNRRFSVGAGPAVLRAVFHALLVDLCVAASTVSTEAMATVPAQFQGTWVPSKGTCESLARVSVAADRLTLFNGKDREVLGGVKMAGPAYFPPDYRGIMAVLITEFDGHQPVTVTFNLQ